MHVLAPGEFGGLESVVRSLAAGQRARGDEVAVAAVVDRPSPEHPWVTAAKAEGIPTHVCAVPPRAYHRERAAVAQICTSFTPDVVHTHGYRPDVLAGGVARRLGHATVTTVHGFTGGGMRNRLYEWLQVRAFRRYGAVVVVSRPLRERLAAAGVPSDRLAFIPNAYAASAKPLTRAAARAALGIPGDGYRLGWVGRLSQEKGPDVLIDAMASLRDLPIEVSFVGTGRDADALAARAQAAGVAHRVTWHGTVREAGRLFSAFDCFVLSSRTEGTPIVLFEAMAVCVPVVATAVGGVPDVVSPSDALLVSRPEPAALAAGIRSVYGDTRSATARAEAARQRLASDFGIPQWVARYDAVYEDALRPLARASA